jgi:hypothetical protein
VEQRPLLLRLLIDLLYQPWMVNDDDDDYGAVDGMIDSRVNRSTLKTPVPMPLCPPQIPYYFTMARTRVAAVGSQWVTT